LPCHCPDNRQNKAISPVGFVAGLSVMYLTRPSMLHVPSFYLMTLLKDGFLPVQM
jgi:hypothetical protein